jgi:DNA replication protein DnaC
LTNLTLTRAQFTPAFLSRLRAAYPGIEITPGTSESSATLDETSVTHEQRRQIELDMRFFDLNPTLPLESICAHLDTYQPKNESQQQLVEYSRRLIDLSPDAGGAGLYMWGEAGIGKSHVAVSLAKIFMEKGLLPNFIVADTYGFDTHLKLAHGQVWIIDDMNSGYGISSRLFKEVILNAHDKGGRVFVTSNKPYDQLMRELFVGDGEANRMRYEDRTKGMFKILHVTGESHRQEMAWWK